MFRPSKPYKLEGASPNKCALDRGVSVYDEDHDYCGSCGWLQSHHPGITFLQLFYIVFHRILAISYVTYLILTAASSGAAPAAGKCFVAQSSSVVLPLTFESLAVLLCGCFHDDLSVTCVASSGERSGSHSALECVRVLIVCK